MEYYTVILKRKGCNSNIRKHLSEELQDGDTNLDIDVRRCRAAHFVYYVADILLGFWSSNVGQATLKALTSSIGQAIIVSTIGKYIISSLIGAGFSLAIGGIDLSDLLTVPFFTILTNSMMRGLTAVPASILTGPMVSNLKKNMPKAKDDLICAMSKGLTKNLDAVMRQHGVSVHASQFAVNVLFVPPLLDVLEKSPGWIPGFELALEKLASSNCCS